MNLREIDSICALWPEIILIAIFYVSSFVCDNYVCNNEFLVYQSLRWDYSEEDATVRTLDESQSRLVLHSSRSVLRLGEDDSEIPILELNSDDPYKRGYDHGSLMHKEIRVLVNKFKTLLRCRILKRDIPVRTIPDVYREEMRGLVDGYNAAITPSTWPADNLTLELVIQYHLLADSKQYELVKPACTCILYHDPDLRRMVFGRNMDWLSFGAAGSLTLLIRTPSCAYWSPPGFVGVVTGINPAGLCLAMNVFPGPRKVPSVYGEDNEGGIPSTFLNRLILDTCGSLDDVDKQLSQNTALGAYHLTVCEPSNNPQRNATYSFMGDDTYTVQRGMPQGSNYRVVVNRNEETGEESFDSSGRKREIEAHGIKSAEDVAKCLRLSSTNTFETVHQFVFHPAERQVRHAFANGFAGDQPFDTFDYSKLWH